MTAWTPVKVPLIIDPCGATYIRVQPFIMTGIVHRNNGQPTTWFTKTPVPTHGGWKAITRREVLVNIECLVIKVSGDYKQDWTCKIVVTVVSSEGIGQCDDTKHYNTSPRCEVSFDTNNLALNGKGRGQDPLHEGEEGYNMEYTSIRTDM